MPTRDYIYNPVTWNDDIGKRAVQEARQVREQCAQEDKQKERNSYSGHLESVIMLSEFHELTWQKRDIEAVLWLLNRLNELEGER